MSASTPQNRIFSQRRWLHYVLQAFLLLSVAGAISIIWSLVEPEDKQIWPTVSESSVPAKESSNGNPIPTETVRSERAATGTTAGKNSKTASEDDIPVYLVGAVLNPGVYIVQKGIYLYELVELAGGLTPEAAASSINLAMRITENQMVKIPTQAESDNSFDPGVVVSGFTSSDAININTATQAMLEELPGVGPATAAAIIADRNKNGPFRQPEDLMRVPGIKESRYVLLEALITVG